MLIEWVWVSWRNKYGWHPKHAVPTQADTRPNECAGLMALCGIYIPENAQEYAYRPAGPCRNYERESPVLTYIMRGATPDSDACVNCRTRLAKERPDLFG
jgi:hypothetical protein